MTRSTERAGLTEKETRIFEILGLMDREETWDAIEKLLVLFTVKDVKEESYDAFFDALKESVLNHSRDFKQFMDKSKTHGHA